MPFSSTIFCLRWIHFANVIKGISNRSKGLLGVTFSGMRKPFEDENSLSKVKYNLFIVEIEAVYIRTKV